MGENWREEVTRNLEYYLDTEEGRRELEELIREETKRILEEARRRGRIKEIIWLSKFCLKCAHFRSSKGFMRCDMFDCRIVKPFYGRPVWLVTIDKDGREELYVGDIDWSRKAIEVSDLVVEKAIERINGGLPYECYMPK